MILLTIKKMAERKRSANWLVPEKSLLLDLVTDHFNMINNKKTDVATIRKKNAEWEKISQEYNAQTVGVHRTADNLKSQWESLKKATKKSAKQSRLHTGGGPAKYTISDPIFDRILGLITTSEVGLTNQFDSDDGINDEDSSRYDTNGEAAQSKVPSETEFVAVSEDSTPTIQDCSNQDWKVYIPRALKTPTSSQLKHTREPSNQQQLTSKRRPSESSFHELQTKKKKTIERQMDFVAAEREMKMFEIKYAIEREKLKQEKIKTRMLLIELRKIKKEGN